jgi:hypothetical protein
MIDTHAEKDDTLAGWLKVNLISKIKIGSTAM